MESNGRKAWLEYGEIFHGEGTFEDLLLAIPLERDDARFEEGRFFTLTELATRDAELIKAAEARARGEGARDIRSVLLETAAILVRGMTLFSHIREDWPKQLRWSEVEGRAHAENNWRRTLGMRLVAIGDSIPRDTAAHDADTRKEERAKVLEDVCGVICQDAECEDGPCSEGSECPIITDVRSLAQDKE